MGNDLQADLRELVTRRRLLVIIGAGVSVSATKNAPAASWPGLLKLGVAHCRKVNPTLDDAWQQRLIGEIDSGDLDDMISAAEKISRKLQAPDGGEFTRWLGETAGALQIREPAVLEALRDLRVPLATTNYDDLLERATHLPAVTWRDQAKVFRVLQGEEQAILHLHGYWDEPASVVLGIRSYEDVRKDAHAQAVIRALAMTQSLLFVGCGDGLSDPNFEPFRSWLRERAVVGGFPGRWRGLGFCWARGGKPICRASFGGNVFPAGVNGAMAQGTSCYPGRSPQARPI